MRLRNLLIAGDVTGLAAAFAVSEWIFHPGGTDRVGLNAEAFTFLISLPVWVLVARAHGLYDNARDRTGHGTVDDIAGVFHLVAVGGWLLFFASYATELANPDPEKLTTFIVLAVIFVTLGRTSARAISRRQTARIQRVVILGAGRIGQLVAKKLRGHPEYGLDVVGFVDADPLPMRSEVEDLRIFGSVADLPQIVQDQNVDRVMVAFSNDRPEELAGVMRRLQEQQVFVDIVPQMFDSIGPSAFVHQVEGLPLVGLPPLRACRLTDFAKRSVDVLGALAALCLLAPVFLIVALRIRLDSPGRSSTGMSGSAARGALSPVQVPHHVRGGVPGCQVWRFACRGDVREAHVGSTEPSGVRDHVQAA